MLLAWRSVLVLTFVGIPEAAWYNTDNLLTHGEIKELIKEVADEFNGSQIFENTQSALLFNRLKTEPTSTSITEEPQSKIHIAMIVAGPSAAGKTTGYHAILAELGWDELRFNVVDGGDIRDKSEVWQKYKKKCLERVKFREGRVDALGGCSDLYTKYFKNAIDAFKIAVIQHYVKRDKRPNLIIPDTLTTSNLTLTYLDFLEDAKYHIKWSAVVADAATCLSGGQAREVEEGKKYSAGWILEYKWRFAFTALEKLWNTKGTFGTYPLTIIENSKWNVLKPYCIEEDNRLGGLAHVRSMKKAEVQPGRLLRAIWGKTTEFKDCNAQSECLTVQYMGLDKFWMSSSFYIHYINGRVTIEQFSESRDSTRPVLKTWSGSGVAAALAPMYRIENLDAEVRPLCDPVEATTEDEVRHEHSVGYRSRFRSRLDPMSG